jgi:hypothetical protein
MVAVTLSTITLFALLSTSVITYKINHKARLRDNARSVLRTYVDQFQRLAYSDEITGTNLIRTIFLPTVDGSGNPVPTGRGLRWGALSDETPNLYQTDVCEIDIGPPGSPQFARVTRSVMNVTPSTGASSATKVSDAAGFMLRATFTITYTITGSEGGRPISQSISTLRLID